MKTWLWSGLAAVVTAGGGVFVAIWLAGYLFEDPKVQLAMTIVFCGISGWLSIAVTTVVFYFVEAKQTQDRLDTLDEWGQYDDARR